ncbi:MAG: DNA oxidative demethylase AlkB [Pseudomonadota bacterium]
MRDLFDDGADQMGARELLAEGAFILRGFALEDSVALLAAAQKVAVQAPFRHMIVPGGRRMSVAITNCGDVGWVSDRKGYRYAPIDPESGLPWPQLPQCFVSLAQSAAAAAGYASFFPDACLINHYTAGTGVSLHQDRNERDFGAPIVSVSLGSTATFLFGGMSRKDRPRRILLHHGDVAVWGGPSRLFFHGVVKLKQGASRHNLTFRKAL